MPHIDEYVNTIADERNRRGGYPESAKLGPRIRASLP